MNNGILDFRFANCDLVSRSGNARCGHDRSGFAELAAGRLNPILWEHASVHDQFHPAGRLNGHCSTVPRSTDDGGFEAPIANRKSKIANP